MIVSPSTAPAAKLLALSASGKLRHTRRTGLPSLLRPGDLVVANDAATLPASLSGRYGATGAPVELRLAGWQELGEPTRFIAVLFGAGDFRTRTGDRLPPPRLYPGDTLALGPLLATVERVLGHPRLISVRFAGTPEAIWAGIVRHGRPIQYAHAQRRFALWDVWTKIAARPVAFEAPSAGFALDWKMLEKFRERGIGFATLTHAAGLSSTGDQALDARLPLDEHFCIPAVTAHAVAQAKESGGRVVAIGTTVVRALEAAALGLGEVRAGEGLATDRIGPKTRLKIVDAIISGVHAEGESHFELLRAFADDASLRSMAAAATARGYRNHEFGDSVLIERMPRSPAHPSHAASVGSRAHACEPAMAL